MKILLVVNDLGSYYNFLQELTLELCKDTKNEVHIVSSIDNVLKIKKGNNVKLLNLHFHQAPIPRGLSPFKLINAAIQIFKLIKSISPDIVHTHFVAASLVSLLIKHNGVYYYSTLHGLGLNSTNGFKRLLFFFIEHFIFLKSDKLFLLNTKDLEYVSKYHPEKANQLNSNGVGCDIETFSPKPSYIVDEIRKELGIEKNAFVVAYTGRFVKFKGFHIAVKSFIMFQKFNIGNSYLILIGGRDNLHKDGLSNKDWDYINKSKNIIKVGFTNNVEKYLSVSNAFLFPSVKEGLPVCVLEALSMGLPVVGFDTRGMNDLIISDFNGLLIKRCEDSEAINQFSSILYLLKNDKHLLSYLSQNTFKNRLNYSRTKFITETIKTYNLSN